MRRYFVLFCLQKSRHISIVMEGEAVLGPFKSRMDVWSFQQPRYSKRNNR